MRIFISYGRRDALDIATKLCHWLRERGYEPWLDTENGIPIGAPFDTRIELGIEGSRLLVALLSGWSLRPEGFCRNELLFAQAKRVPIVPVRVADVTPPIQIISLNYVDACENPESAFEALPSVIEQVARTGSVGFRDWPSAEADGADPWWKRLRELRFEEELACHGGPFVGRDWLFSQIGDWIAQPDSRLLLLTADAGVGKSAIAAQMTARLNVRSVHFCTRSKTESCRASAWLGSVVYQVAAQFEAYRSEVEGLSTPNWGEPGEALFRQLVSEPLSSCRGRLDVAEPWVFVIDGLDESLAQAGPELTDLLADSAQRIPEWLRLIVTSRPDQNVLPRFRLREVEQLDLTPDREQNRADLQEYVARRAQRLVAEGVIADRPGTAERVADLAAGNFLYAQVTLDALGDSNSQRRLSLDELGSLPYGLDGLYSAMFAKRYGEATGEAHAYAREIRPLLDCLVAAQAPLPDDLLIAASGLEAPLARKGLLALSQFLNRDEADALRLFHRSVADWLADPKRSGGYSALPDRGHLGLARACWQEFDRDPTGVSSYVRAHMPTHLAETRMWDELLSVAVSPELGLLERWVELGDVDQGTQCLTGLVRHGPMEPVYAAALAAQLARIHSLRGQYVEAREWLEYAIARTSWRHGRRTHVVALHELGSLHLYRGDKQQAHRLYQRALRLCTWARPVYRDEAAANRIALATIAYTNHRWRDVLRLAGRARGEAESAGDLRHAISAQGLIAVTMEDLARYDEARAGMEETLRSSRLAPAPLEEARLLVALGWFHYREAHLAQRPPTEARAYFVEAMDAARRIHNLYAQVDARGGMGWCDLADRATAQAGEWFRQAADALPTGAHPELLVRNDLGLAAVTHQTGDLPAAERSYAEVAGEAERRDFRDLGARALAGHGAVLWHTGRKPEAETAWSRALDYAQRNSPRAVQITEANIRLCKVGPDVTPW